MLDYFCKPKILDIYISEWDGQVGKPIYILALDNVRVTWVCLIIRANGETYDALDGGLAAASELGQIVSHLMA